MANFNIPKKRKYDQHSSAEFHFFLVRGEDGFCLLCYCISDWQAENLSQEKVIQKIWQVYIYAEILISNREFKTQD